MRTHRASRKPGELKIIRIRRVSGVKGGAYRYHHADVLARDWRSAMRAAREGRITNWRYVSSFNWGSVEEDYERFTVLNGGAAPLFPEGVSTPKDPDPNARWKRGLPTRTTEYNEVFYAAKIRVDA